ncbi:DUF3618 domain-containing protein [Streptomyces lydicus]|uniref:DUF3618 domain-containing protein n=1 Tax=Streptomyces lydicus TaxID=47763 RepID=UPI003435A28A
MREQVEGTREQLGQTVEELAGKADIKSRAKDKTATLTTQAKDTALHAKEQMQHKVAELAHQAQDKTPEPVRQKAAAARSDLARRAATVAEAVEHKTPEPVRDKAQQVTQAARHRPGALLAAGAVVLLALVMARRTRRHR